MEMDLPAPARRRESWLRELARGIVVLIWLIPVLWIVTTAFKPDDLISSATPVLVFPPTLAHLGELFASQTFGRYALNSIVICLTATALTVVVAAPAAYVFSAYHLRFEKPLALGILSFKLLPPIVLAIPYYIMFQQLGWKDSFHGMVFVYLVFSLPFAVWLLRSFFIEIPIDVIEAARLDGMTEADVIGRVVLPIALPGVAVTAVFTFLFLWNEFLFAFFLTDERAKTIPVAISSLILEYQILWGQMAMAATLALIPLAVVVFLLQRHIVRGMTLGAIK